MFTWSFEGVESSFSSSGNLLQGVSKFLIVSIASFFKAERSYCVIDSRRCVVIANYVYMDI